MYPVSVVCACNANSIITFVRIMLSVFVDCLSGYGHSTPNTISGKLFTMFYAIVGIPLGLVMFQSIGERLNKFSSVVIRNVKKLLNCKDVQVKRKSQTPLSFRLYLTPNSSSIPTESKFKRWNDRLVARKKEEFFSISLRNIFKAYLIFET